LFFEISHSKVPLRRGSRATPGNSLAFAKLDMLITYTGIKEEPRLELAGFMEKLKKNNLKF